MQQQCAHNISPLSTLSGGKDNRWECFTKAVNKNPLGCIFISVTVTLVTQPLAK